MKSFHTPVWHLIRVIDHFTAVLMAGVALLLVPMILGNVVEVFMRYALDSPTVWAADVTVMTFGAFFMLGSAYTMLKGAHVRTDIFWDRFTDRTKGIIDSISYLLLFLPVMALLFAISIDDLAYSFSIKERSTMSLWGPVMWPFRAVIPLAALMMFVQGISELLKALWAASTGEVLVRPEKIEI